MNAKLCKILRKRARELTVGFPAYNLVVRSTNKATGVNSPKSTRGVYRRLKNEARRIGRG